MIICISCKSNIADNEEKCPTCGWNAGPPNVRTVSREEEREALEKRYNEAIQNAISKGAQHALESFDENMKRTCAVINMDIDFLHWFVTDDKLVYSTYDLSVDSEARKPATPKDDRHRKTVGAMLYGHKAKEIRYAALSLDGGGLTSYGPYTIRLREIAIMERATLLEDNSYQFISTHDIKPGGDIPPGYTATWKERHKLAVAKLADEIHSGTAEQEHPKILLSSEGNRGTDRFIEVHIYGGFDNNAIESVRGSSSVKATSDRRKAKFNRAALSIIKDHLKKKGKAWVEE